MSTTRALVRDFLVSRRARIGPEQAGLTLYGGNRRVPGLRREEVALLAGLSVDYYTKLEKGGIAGASLSVLHAVCDALRLDEAERSYLLDLARTANGQRGRTARPRARQVRPALQHLIDAMPDSPAFIRNGRLDVVAANRMAEALLAPVFSSPLTAPGDHPNFARFGFLDPAAHDLFPDWEQAARTHVAILRTEAGRDPEDSALSRLVGELSTRSDRFRTLWAAQDVRLHRTGVKGYLHEAVGSVTVGFESVDLPADPGLNLTVYLAEPGSRSADALQLIAAWAATHDQENRPVGRTAPDTRRA